jgi:hypothetical protein
MRRIAVSLWWTYILALCFALGGAALSTSAAADPIPGMQEPIDGPAVSGDPDMPSGGGKIGGWGRGVPRGAMQPRFGLVGDEPSGREVWMWRLRAAAMGLKLYVFRF